MMQMISWAEKKHASYLSEFPNYKKLNRTPVFPFVGGKRLKR
jgi:hypothetical protein